MHLTEITTRSELVEALDSLGVTGAAADAIVRETAAARHAPRVSAAKEAALAEAERLREPADEHGAGVLAALLCLLELAGVGGREGVEGIATKRIPAFEQLGKGRKQASDGGAWTAAIAQAAGELVPGGRLFAGGGALGLFQPWSSGEGYKAIASMSIEALREAGLAPWAMTIAREGLRRALGLEPWLGLEFDLPRGCTQVWAQLVNELAAAPTPAVE